MASARANQNSDQEHAVLQKKRGSPRRYRGRPIECTAELVASCGGRYVGCTRNQQHECRDRLRHVAARSRRQSALLETYTTVWGSRFGFGAGGIERGPVCATARVHDAIHSSAKVPSVGRQTDWQEHQYCGQESYNPCAKHDDPMYANGTLAHSAACGPGHVPNLGSGRFDRVFHASISKRTRRKISARAVVSPEITRTAKPAPAESIWMRRFPTSRAQFGMLLRRISATAVPVRSRRAANAGYQFILASLPTLVASSSGGRGLTQSR